MPASVLTGGCVWKRHGRSLGDVFQIGGAMAAKRQGDDWSEVAVAMDRGLRMFSDFSKPVLAAHAADNLSLSNLLFLLSVGDGEARVNDLVRKGRYVGSNASYALKSLQEGGFIERRQDPVDRRNAVVCCTPRGKDLLRAMRAACAAPSGVPAETGAVLSAFENHCARLPES